MTLDRLRAGAYVTDFPELYALRKVIENSPSHQQQNVFDHEMAVYESLETSLTGSALPEEAKGKWLAYLAQLVTTLTKAEVLKIAALCHDLAKSETAIQHSDGTVTCPGHEHLGAVRAVQIAERFGASQVESERVSRIVLHHGFIAQVLELIVAHGQAEHFWIVFTEAVGDVWPELLLLMHADLHGSDLGKANPELLAVYLKQLGEWMTQKAVFLK